MRDGCAWQSGAASSIMDADGGQHLGTRCGTIATGRRSESSLRAREDGPRIILRPRFVKGPRWTSLVERRSPRVGCVGTGPIVAAHSVSPRARGRERILRCAGSQPPPFFCQADSHSFLFLDFESDGWNGAMNFDHRTDSRKHETPHRGYTAPRRRRGARRSDRR